jgi:hypothetical protein
MQRQIKYNLNCPESDRLLEELYMVCNTIKDGLHKKEYEVYESLLNRLHQLTAMQVNIFNKEIHEFKSNDSDNESNYDENIRNVTNEEFAEDSVSEYETDSEDEDYQKTKPLLEEHDKKCEKNLVNLKEYFLFEI